MNILIFFVVAGIPLIGTLIIGNIYTKKTGRKFKFILKWPTYIGILVLMMMIHITIIKNYFPNAYHKINSALDGGTSSQLVSTVKK
ncbi:MAG: hypothetical protein GY756_25605 [bacterium]|nr:hypothetical protein [bacterium]